MNKSNYVLPGFLMIIFFVACQNTQQKAKTEVEKTEEKVMITENNSTITNKKIILCFGNSLTAGYGLDENQAWPYLMQERLDSLDMPYLVVNAGLSGETSAGGLGRIDWVLNQPIDYFILELGANDMLRGLDVTATYDNLQGILDKVKEKNPDIKIIVAGLLTPPNMGHEYEKAFNRIFPDLAAKYDATRIPFFLEGVAGIDSLNLVDGKHPNAIGQKIVLENVWESLISII